MGTEDFIDLQASSGSGSSSEKSELHTSYFKPSNSSQVKEDIFKQQKLGQVVGDGGNGECEPLEKMNVDKALLQQPPTLQENGELTEPIAMAAKMTSVVNSEVNSENGCLSAQNGTTISNRRMDDSPISGVKRARLTYDDQQPSVHVIYNSLTRDSKRKLEELLHQWSDWHAQHNSSSNDSNEVLESGEETYFPAINVGLEKSSTVSFWIDNQARIQQRKEIPLDGETVPLYDRRYALVLTSMEGSTNLERESDTFEASRCFNCGSYNHSLKECSKPRDNAAVNNARKQHNSKRNQTAGARNATRYYQNSPGGKYDGTRPGVLGAETRQLMALGELDPPPWLQRMREMGYPPGYLELADDEQPSGIKIYAGEETNEKKDDEEMLETEDPEPIMPKPEKKMTVEFPGINAPIPENADERRWAALSRTSSFDSSRNRSHQRSNRSSDVISNGHYRDQRSSRDYGDNGSPVCDPVVSPSISGLMQRSSSFDLSYASESHSPRGIPVPRSPYLGRSLSDRGRSPLVHDGSPSYSLYSSASYSSPIARQTPQNYSSPSFENWTNENQYSSFNLSSQRMERHNYHHHHNRR